MTTLWFCFLIAVFRAPAASRLKKNIHSSKGSAPLFQFHTAGGAGSFLSSHSGSPTICGRQPFVNREFLSTNGRINATH
jgi:hypothetical protein